MSRRLTLRPFIGLKFGWIDQHAHVEYKDANGVDNEFKYNLEQDKFGVGIRTGLNTAWFMWNKWSIYGNFAASALYSDFDNSQKLKFSTPATKSVLLNFKHGHHEITPVLEFGLGLRFQTDFYDHYEFLLQAGWEEQVWFNENQFANLTNDRGGNMTLQGLTIKAGFSF